MNEIKAPLSISELLSRHEAVLPYFNEMWKSAEENERYKQGIHDPSIKSAIEKQNRVDYVINMMTTKLNQILSYQQNNRTEFKIKAIIDPMDEIKASIGNIVFKDYEHRNNFKYLESDIADSGITIKYGVAKIYLGKDSQMNNVVMTKDLDYKNFVWDSNATTYSKNDALFMCEIEKVYRYQIREEYGEESAKKVSSGEHFEWGRDKDAYFISPNNMNEDYDIVSKFTHYEKVLRDYWVLIFNDYLNKTQIVERFTDKTKAEYRNRELLLPYLDQNLDLPESSIEKTIEEELDKYVFTMDSILEYEETELIKFPYSLYFSFTFKDKVWCFADLLKPLQQFVDRYFSQIDYALGKDIKNVYELAVNQLADGLNYEKALEIIEDSGIVPVKSIGSIKAVRSQGINPQWTQMITLVQSYLEDIAGGRSFQGLSEGANESGVSVEKKAQQGALIAALFLENIKRWKKDLGEKLLWWFNKYDTAERVIKVGGGELNPEMIQLLQQSGGYTPSMSEPNGGYVKINSNPLTIFKDAEFELLVSDSPYSETVKNQKFAKLAILSQTVPNIQTIPEYTRLLLETQDIDYDSRQKLLQGLENQMKAQAEMAQAEIAQKQQEKQSKTQIEQGKLKLQALELGLNAGKPEKAEK